MSGPEGPRGTVALVGGGVVSSAWALVVARAGYAVRLYDVAGGLAGVVAAERRIFDREGR